MMKIGEKIRLKHKTRHFLFDTLWAHTHLTIMFEYFTPIVKGSAGSVLLFYDLLGRYDEIQPEIYHILFTLVVGIMLLYVVHHCMKSSSSNENSVNVDIDTDTDSVYEPAPEFAKKEEEGKGDEEDELELKQKKIDKMEKRNTILSTENIKLRKEVRELKHDKVGLENKISELETTTSTSDPNDSVMIEACV